MFLGEGIFFGDFFNESFSLIEKKELNKLWALFVYNAVFKWWECSELLEDDEEIEEVKQFEKEYKDEFKKELEYELEEESDKEFT